MLRIKALAFCMFFITAIFGQNNFKAEEVQLKKYALTLEKEFKSYNLYQLDLAAMDQLVQKSGEDIHFNLKLGSDHNWDFSIYPQDIRTEDYNLYVQTENGVEIYPKRPNMTYRGYLDGAHGGKVGLTINDHLFAGTVKQGDEFYFVEPLHFLIKDAPKDILVVYEVTDVIPHEGLKCGADELIDKSNYNFDQHEGHDHAHDGLEKSAGLCLEVELAIASDWLMYLDYNSSATQVEDHNITVMNNVAANWDDEFADEIVFVIVTQFLSTCNTCDPWTTSTNAVTLLNDFRSWGNGGGFGVTFDLGQLWTDRNFNGGTVGVAYVGGVCTSSKYHVLQDFTSNAQQLRVMTAHEIGHNFDALHDGGGSGFIMQPSVSTSTIWSAASISDINSMITTRFNQGCFAECVSTQPPVPDFVGNQTSGCVPLEVQFTDLTVNTPTQWSWSFPGGTPNTSTNENPFVIYNAPGIYDVSLTVTNSAGSNTITKTSYINAFGAPLTGFNYSINNDLAVFTNTTQNGLTYNWDFGDGMTSTEFSPIHYYEEDGTYIVTLISTNACGTSVHTEVIVIATLPEPGFTSNVTNGCAPLVVAFEDLSSSNSEFYLWEMPGASPDQSAEENPIVVYNTSGTYDVTLTVINGVGSNTITIENYITVDPLPIPGFTFNANGTSVDFTNTSTEGISYSWDFGDGNTSSLENPMHTYDSGGTYFVELTATNDCGEQTIVETIEIATAPIAGINADTLMGCAPLTVQFFRQLFLRMLIPGNGLFREEIQVVHQIKTQKCYMKPLVFLM